jgi:hypothetical protein
MQCHNLAFKMGHLLSPVIKNVRFVMERRELRLGPVHHLSVFVGDVDIMIERQHFARRKQGPLRCSELLHVTFVGSLSRFSESEKI